MIDQEKPVPEEHTSSPKDKTTNLNQEIVSASFEYENDILNTVKEPPEKHDTPETAEQILRDFVAHPLSISREVPEWMERYQGLIQERLGGAFPSGYIEFFYRAVVRDMRYNMKDRVIAAVTAYELEQFDQLSAKDQKMLFKLAARVVTLDKKNHNLVLAAFEGLPLEKLSPLFKKGKGFSMKKENDRAFSLLSHLALSRLEQESEEARHILNVLLRKIGLKQILEDTHHDGLYTPEVVEYVADAYQKNDQRTIKTVMEMYFKTPKVRKFFLPLATGCEYSPTIARACRFYLESLPITNVYHLLELGLLSILEYCPKESAIVQVIIDLILNNKVLFEEFYKGSYGDAFAYSRTIDSSLWEIICRFPQIERACEEFAAVQSQAEEKEDENQIDLLLMNLSKFKVLAFDVVDTGSEIHVTQGPMTQIFSTPDILPFLLEPWMWEVIHVDGLGKKFNLSGLFDLQQEVERLLDPLQLHKHIDASKKKNLTSLWQQVKPKIEAELYSLLNEKFDPICSVLRSYFSLEGKRFMGIYDTTLYWRGYYRKYFGKPLENILNTLFKDRATIQDQTYHSFLQRIERVINDCGEQLKDRYDQIVEEREREEEREHEEREEASGAEMRKKLAEAIEEHQKEYLLSRVEQQTEYLQKLYSLATGLKLAAPEVHAKRSTDVHTASVSLAVHMRMEQHLELRIELLRPDSELEIQMDDTLPSIIKRSHMVNWVAPHEIGHIVDSVLGNPVEALAGEKRNDIDAVVQSLDSDYQSVVDEILEMTLQECVIDGIGFSMLRDYGTTNPAEVSLEQRISAAREAFFVTSEVFVGTVRNEQLDDEELQVKYQVVLLRLIAVGESLGVDVSGLLALYDELSTAVQCFNEESQGEIKRLCQACFTAGMNIALR